MTKPQLVKVEALFYVLQQVIKRSCAYFDTAPFDILYLCLGGELSATVDKDSQEAHKKAATTAKAIMTAKPTPTTRREGVRLRHRSGISGPTMTRV